MFRRILAVEFEEPGAELTLTKADSLTRLNPEQIPAADRELFESPPRALVVELTAADQILRGTLTAASPRYRADVVVTAVAESAGWKQRISARCEPEASPVNSVLIRLAPRPTTPVTWRVVDAEHEPIALRECPARETKAPPVGAHFDRVRRLLGRKAARTDRRGHGRRGRHAVLRAARAPDRSQCRWHDRPDRRS